MRLERGASNTFTLAARPTLTPSRWLLRFVHATEEGVYQLCIANAIANVGRPVQLTFAEVSSNPDPQDAEVTLSPGQWNLYVYEQDTTSLNWTLANRLVFEQLIEVVGAAAPPPEPTDPCSGGGGDCPECDPLTATLGSVEIINEADPCGAEITLNCSDPVNLLIISGGTIYDGTYYPIWEEADQHWHYYLDGDVNAYAMVMRGVWSIGAWTADPPGTEQWPWDAVFSSLPDMVLTQGTIGDICGGVAPACDPLQVTVNGEAYAEVVDPCGEVVIVTVRDEDNVSTGSLDGPVWRIPSAVIQLRDSAGNAIGSPDSYVPGTVADKTAPDGSFQRQDSAGNNIGAPIAVRSNQTGVVATCPDATAVVKNLNGTTLITEAILSNASENIIAPIPLKFGWGAGDADTLVWTVTDDEAGSYTAYTDDGGSGTITHSKNGGAFAAVSGPITLAVSDTIVVRRTITTNAGFSRWAP